MDIARLVSTHRKWLLVGFLLLILIFLATFPLYAKTYDIRVLTFILIYVVLATSWAMFSGTTGYMSLAPAAFFGAGIYSMALLQNELPFPLVMVVGGAIAFVFALLIGTIAGTYSSPFVAAPLLVLWERIKKKNH